MNLFWLFIATLFAFAAYQGSVKKSVLMGDPSQEREASIGGNLYGAIFAIVFAVFVFTAFPPDGFRQHLWVALGAGLVMAGLLYFAMGLRKEAKQDTFKGNASKGIDYSHQTPDDCPPQRISFYYTDSKGNSSHRDVSVVSYGPNHFCGHCHTRDEMRTFRFDRLHGMAVLYDTGEEIPHNKLRRYLSIGFNNDLVQLTNITHDLAQLEASVMGFDAVTYDNLCQLAGDYNVKVRKSLAQNVVFLCAGYDVTSAQIRAARERDLPVISAYAFYRLVTMGDIGEDEEPHEYFTKQMMVN